MSAPTIAVGFVIARAAVRSTGVAHVASQRDTGALNPVCGANPIRSREIEIWTTRTDDAIVSLCQDCASLAEAIGSTVAAGLDTMLRSTATDAVRAALVAPEDLSLASTARTVGPDDELVGSLRLYGVLQPVIVRHVGAKLKVIAGARRVSAALHAALASIPVMIVDLDDDESVLASLTENLHREDLDPIALALRFQDAVDSLGISKADLARQLGISRERVSNTIRLLQLPESIQAEIAVGAITAAHGRELLRATDPAQRAAMVDRILAGAMTAKAAEAAVRPAAHPQLDGIADLLAELLGAHVQVTARADRARIVIDVPDADLARVLGSLGVQAVTA